MTKNVGEVVIKMSPSYTDGENANGEATLENSLEVPQKIKHRVTIWHSSSLLGIWPREMKTCPHRILHMNVHNSILYKSQKVEFGLYPQGTLEDAKILKKIK